MIPLTVDNRMLAYESFGSCANISHFVTTRMGGCGEGAYGTFNCSPYCGDDPATVEHNRQRLIEALPQAPREFIIPRQTHGTEVRIIDEAFQVADATTRKALLHGVDAVVTRLPGYCLCISTADCIPLLLYDKRTQVIAAIHAGWRGTVNRIVAHTLEQMQIHFGTQGADVWACIGPGISPASFEVGEEVYDTFLRNGFNMQTLSLRNAQTGKRHIDLWEANRLALLDFGVPAPQIETAGICTYIHHEQFFSARRLGIQSGRILSGIMIH